MPNFLSVRLCNRKNQLARLPLFAALIALLHLQATAQPQYVPPPPPPPATQSQPAPEPPPTHLSGKQLDQLVSRIALYPDRCWRKFSQLRASGIKSARPRLGPINIAI